MSDSVPRPVYGSPIVLADAKRVAHAIEAHATAAGLALVVVIVEPAGPVVLSVKMDDAPYGSLDVARRKAETAAAFKRATRCFQDAVRAGVLNALSNGALAIEGGEPLIVDGRIVGAVGVSGGAPEEDGLAARVGAAVLSRAPTLTT